MPYAKPTSWRYRVFLVTAVLVFSSATVCPQKLSAIKGRWVWKQIARQNKPQTQFTVMIDDQEGVVRGVYSVDEFINSKWQGEDGNQTPFLGRVIGSRIELEFDPFGTVPGYEQNVTYRPPTDNQKRSTAVITLNGQTLRWRLIRGRGIKGVPARVTLKRARARSER